MLSAVLTSLACAHIDRAHGVMSSHNRIHSTDVLDVIHVEHSFYVLYMHCICSNLKNSIINRSTEFIDYFRNVRTPNRN